MNLQEYAAKAKRAPTPQEQWFNERPDVKEQVLSAFAARPPMQTATVYKWLEEYHGYPYQSSTLGRYRQMVMRDAG